MGIIYCIHNLTTGKKYIGQTVSYFTRILKGERKTYKGWSIKILDSGQESGYNDEESKPKKQFFGVKF